MNCRRGGAELLIRAFWDLVRLVRLEAGRSASFRLRFRFVRVMRAVRAGEAKLRGRMTNDIPIAGPAGCYVRRVCGRLSASRLLLFIMALIGFSWSLWWKASFLLLFICL